MKQLDKKGWKRVRFGDVCRNLNVTVKSPEENGYDKDDIEMFDSEYHDGFQISIEEIFTVNSDKILFEDIEKFFVDKPLKNYKIDNFKDDANNNEDGLYMIGITFFI